MPRMELQAKVDEERLKDLPEQGDLGGCKAMAALQSDRSGIRWVYGVEGSCFVRIAEV